MDEAFTLWERPDVKELYMIAGWRQWADAGSISSNLPKYLIEQTRAREIGEIHSHGFYLFQIPGTHHFLRPEIKLKDGYRESLQKKRNVFYYANLGEKGLVIFLGDEPHMNAETYADSFLSVVQELGVRRVVAVGGVFGPVPYEKDREISCVYSLPEIKTELDDYALIFSNYEGGTTIGTYLVDQAEQRGIEFVTLYAFVPAYDLSELSSGFRGLQIETDYKAWYDLMLRINHMFDLTIDLEDLEEKSQELTRSVDANIDGLDQRLPEPQVRAFLQDLTKDFTEQPFVPLSDVWEQGLEDLFHNGEE